MGKLVRDKIPDIIRCSGRTPHATTLDQQAYRSALRAKLAYLVCTEELLNSRARSVPEMRLIATLSAFVEWSHPSRELSARR